MGDATTHAIFHQGYWFLVYLENGKWIGTFDFQVVCSDGDQEKVVDLTK